MSAYMSNDEYGGAQIKVKHPAECKTNGFPPFVLDDIVTGNFFWFAFATLFNRHSPTRNKPGH